MPSSAPQRDPIELPAPLASAESAASDAELLLAVSQRRDQEAFNTLYLRHEKRLFQLALHLSHDLQEAQDVFQKALLRIWSGCRHYRPQPQSTTFSYLAQILFNEALKARRNRHRRCAREKAVREECQHQDGLGTVAPLEDEPWGEAMGLLRKKLLELPDQERRLAALYYGCGLTQKEVARALGQPQRTVSHQLRRMLNRMRAALAECGMAALPAAQIEAMLRACQDVAPSPPSGMLLQLQARIASDPELRAGLGRAFPQRGRAKAAWLWGSGSARGLKARLVAVLAAGLAAAAILAWFSGTAPGPHSSATGTALAAPGGTGGSPLGKDRKGSSEVLYEDQFDGGPLDPFWVSGRDSKALRFEKNRYFVQAKGAYSLETVLTLSAQRSQGAEPATVEEIGLRSRPLDLSGGRSGYIELASLTPEIAGPAEYGVMVLGVGGKVIWHQGYRVEPAAGRKGFLVREIYRHGQRTVSSNFGVQFRQSLFAHVWEINLACKNVSGGFSAQHEPDLLAHDDPTRMVFSTHSEQTTEQLEGIFWLYCYAKAFPGATIKWPLNWCKVTRTRNGVAQAPGGKAKAVE